MKNYEKPIVLINEELAEGVYAASGDGSCWVMNPEFIRREQQNPSEKFAEYRIDAWHNKTGVKHISRSTTINVAIISNGLKSVEVDGVKAYPGQGEVQSASGNPQEGFKVSCTASSITIKRSYLGDSYESGDHFNILVRIDDTDGNASITGLTWSCEKQINVQGEGGNE